MSDPSQLFVSLISPWHQQILAALHYFHPRSFENGANFQNSKLSVGNVQINIFIVTISLSYMGKLCKIHENMADFSQLFFQAAVEV